jgi:hypothetical protein
MPIRARARNCDHGKEKIRTKNLTLSIRTMPLEALLANYEDLQRLERLEAAGHFRPGFAKYSRTACIKTLVRIFELAVSDLFIPYAGPTVTH